MDYFYFFAILGASLIMAGAFLFEQKTGSSGYIDSIWALNVGVFAIAAAYPFNDFRAGLISFLVAIWAIRLGGHILQRTKKIPDDPRYFELKKSWGKHASRNLFWFLQIQALCAFILIAAIRIGISRPNQDWHIFDTLALIISIVALFGEAIADNQLREFKAKNPPKSICNIWLWKLSRHPNYFFEFVFWCSISLFAFDFHAPNFASLLAIIAPLMMYYLLNYASGIPPLEAHMRKSRGVEFENYMRVTRPFFPFPK